MIGILCVNSCLKSVSFNRDIFLFFFHWPTHSNVKLPSYEINSSYFFCYWMLYLKTGIHLHKPKSIFLQTIRPINNKFYCPCAFVAYSFSCTNSCSTHSISHFIGHSWSWALLQYFLMPAL